MRHFLCVLAVIGVLFPSQVLAASDKDIISMLNEADQIADQAKKLTDNLNQAISEMMPAEKWVVEMKNFLIFLEEVKQAKGFSNEQLPFAVRRDRYVLVQTLQDIKKKIKEKGEIDTVLLQNSIKDIRKLRSSLLKYVGTSI